MGKKRLERAAEEHPSASPEPPREIEIKFRADKAALDALAKSVPLKGGTLSPARELRSVYYDTTERDLQRHGIAFRIRRKAKATPVMSMKRGGVTSAAVFSREEVEVPCPDGTPDLDLFDPATRERLAAAAGGKPLEPVFEARVRRRLGVLRHGTTEIELALDEGVISAGEARLRLCEIELELKSGDLQDLIDCSTALAGDFGLRLDFEAKSDRGYRLASGAVPQARKAEPLVLHESIGFDDLLAAVISHTLGHFISNWAVLRETDVPEAVHQLRVALRRMRSALGAFRKVAESPELETIRQDAKRIASSLGLARECDVFRENAMQGPLRQNPAAVRGAVPLLEMVESQRKQAYAEARRILEETDTSLFVLKVQRFITDRAWQSASSPQERGSFQSSGRSFAVSVLDRLLRRCLKRGKHLRAMTDEERHELRIALKNLRYASEFFGSLFGEDKRRRRFVKRVAELQEDFGARNDAATAEAFIEKLGLPPEGDIRFASGFLLGWYRHASAAADEHLMRNWKSFETSPAFWN